MLPIFFDLLESEADEIKFCDIYHKYKSFVFMVVKEITKDNALAEDAAQETFCKIAKYIKRIERVDSPTTKAFINTIARSAAFDLMRNEWRQKRYSMDENDRWRVTYQDSVETDLLRRQLRERVEALPDEYRDPIILKYYFGMKSSEIADILHVKATAVRKRLQRGRQLLATELEYWRLDG